MLLGISLNQFLFYMPYNPEVCIYVSTNLLPCQRIARMPGGSDRGGVIKSTYFTTFLMVELSSNIEEIFIKFGCTVVLRANVSRLMGRSDKGGCGSM